MPDLCLERVLTRDTPTVSPNTSIRKAIALVESSGYVIALESGKIAGIVTGKEICKAIAAGKEIAKLKVAAVMERSIVTLTHTGTETARDAWNLLREKNLEYLPVIDEAGKFLGIVTAANLVAAIDLAPEIKYRERESSLRRQFQQILDSIADMVLVKAKDSRVIWANQAFRDYYGMELEELRGIVDAPFNAPAHTLQYLRDDEYVISTGQTLEVPDEPVTRHDGEIRRFSTVKAPIRDDRGEIVALVGVSRDITHQKQAAERLRQREEFLSGIYNGAEQAIFVIDVSEDREFRYLDFNPIAERYAGMTNREIQGKTPEEAFGTRIGGAFREKYARCLQAGTSITYEERIGFEDREIWTLTTLSPLRDAGGAIYRLIGTATDITDRKQATARLQQQLEREQLIAEITDHIRRSLNVNEVLQRTVDRVRGVLQTDRAIVFRFDADWRGEVVTESVASGVREILATVIHDPCFGDRYAEPYRAGRVSAIDDIRERALDPCYLQLLQHFQVRADLVVPILQGEALWGLLIAHHSTPRAWRDEEIELLRQLALQAGIALQQSELYQRTRRELEERQRIQNALVASEAKFRSLSESAPIGIYLTDSNGNNLYANDRLQDTLGFDDLRAIGDAWVEAIHPDDRDAVFAGWRAFLAGEGNPVPEFRLVTPEGETRWVASRIAPIRASGGEITGYVGNAIDITDRVSAEFALRKSERRYAALAEASPVGIFRFDPSGQCVYVNRRWCEMTGRGFEEAMGTEWVRAVHPDDRESLVQKWTSWWSGDRDRPYRNEGRFLRPDGTLCHCYAQVLPETDESGEIVGYVGSLTDIGDRVRAEEALRESEARFQAILDYSPAVIYLIDRENKHLLVNRRYARLISGTVEGSIGKSIFEIWPEETATVFAEQNRAVLETGELLQIEEVVPRGDGIRTYLTMKFPLLDATGRAYAVCGISTDVTERKQLEEQIYRARRWESLGTLAGGMAHDLNNIFTPILAIAQVLSPQLEDSGEATRELLDVLESTAKRGAEMVRQILAFARRGGGTRVPVSIAPLLQEAFRLARETFPRSIALELSLPGEALPHVSADPTQLQRVLMNLTVNARDALPDGGRITLGAEKVSIDEKYARLNLDARAGDYVAIAVTDTGTGISPEAIDSIFDPFFTTKEVGKGTGLGLSTVLGLVRDHGGFIRVQSAVGRGSRFTVYLPAIDLSSQSGHDPADQFGSDDRLADKIIGPGLENPLD